MEKYHQLQRYFDGLCNACDSLDEIKKELEELRVLAAAEIDANELDHNSWKAEAMAARGFLDVVEYAGIDRVDVLTFAQDLTKRRAYAAARAANTE